MKIGDRIIITKGRYKDERATVMSNKKDGGDGMKKDKKWLLNELKEMLESPKTNIAALDTGYELAIKDLKESVIQLDEPEITEEQAWKVIELENSYHLAPAHTKVYKESIQNGVKPECFNEPEKPVIPQFVADWLEEAKCNKLTLFGAMIESLREVDYWFIESDSTNQDLFARAWLDGYEVEKEKRYYISDEMDNATLMTFDLSDEDGEELIEFVAGYSENETIHFDSKEKAELIARFVGDSVKVKEVTE